MRMDCVCAWKLITKLGLAQFQDPRKKSVELVVLDDGLRPPTLGDPEGHEAVELISILLADCRSRLIDLRRERVRDYMFARFNNN